MDKKRKQRKSCITTKNEKELMRNEIMRKNKIKEMENLDHDNLGYSKRKYEYLENRDIWSKL